jgi:hypothetical protein
MHSAEIGDLIEEWAIQDQEAEANEKGKYPDKTSITSCLFSFLDISNLSNKKLNILIYISL